MATGSGHCEDWTVLLAITFDVMDRSTEGMLINLRDESQLVSRNKLNWGQENSHCTQKWLWNNVNIMQDNVEQNEHSPEPEREPDPPEAPRYSFRNNRNPSVRY